MLLPATTLLLPLPPLLLPQRKGLRSAAVRLGQRGRKGLQQGHLLAQLRRPLPVRLAPTCAQIARFGMCCCATSLHS